MNADYLLALGSIAHYLKRAKQFKESRGTSEPLPPRWMHLAERSIQHRSIQTYGEYFGTSEKHSELDKLVHEINTLLQADDIQTDLLEQLYDAVCKIVTPSEAQSPSLPC